MGESLSRLAAGDSSAGQFDVANFLWRTNRVDMGNVWIGLSFAVLYSLFIMLVITARGRRVSTLALGSLYFITLYAFVYGLTDSQWFVAHETDFVSSYCVYNRSLAVAKADLKVKVGLKSFNVSYVSHDENTFSYSEYFEFESDGWPSSLKVRHLISKGLYKTDDTFFLPSKDPTTVHALDVSAPRLPLERKIILFLFGWYL